MASVAADRLPHAPLAEAVLFAVPQPRDVRAMRPEHEHGDDAR